MLYYHVLVMQALVDTKNQVTDEIKKNNDKIKKKLNKHDLELSYNNTLLKQFLVQNKTSFPYNIDSPKSQDPTTVVLVNKRNPRL